jgi:hypothetical protein
LEGRKSSDGLTAVLQQEWDIGMPEAPRPHSPAMSRQHCFSSAVSWAAGAAHATIGPPNRRTTSNSRRLKKSFISEVYVSGTRARGLSSNLSDTVARQRLHTKTEFFELHWTEAFKNALLRSLGNSLVSLRSFSRAVLVRVPGVRLRGATK